MGYAAWFMIEECLHAINRGETPNKYSKVRDHFYTIHTLLFIEHISGAVVYTSITVPLILYMKIYQIIARQSLLLARIGYACTLNMQLPCCDPYMYMY